MSLYGGIEIPGHPDLVNVARLDRLPIPQIRRMQRYGMCVDREYFYALTDKFSTQAKQYEIDIASYIPLDRLEDFAEKSIAAEEANEGYAAINASSAEQIGKLLFDILNIGSDKPLKTTKGGQRLSTGKRQLEMIRMEHPVVPLVLRHRELKKLVTTYTTKLPRLAKFHPRGNCCPLCELPHKIDMWRVHGTFGTTRAATGRINHRNPNLGNIPTRTEDGQAVQAGFIAPPGYKIVARDLSQIELRDLAHLANAKSMIDVYAINGDIHDNTARKVFNLPPDVKPDKIKHRMASKRTNFGIQNGTTEKGLFMQLVMDYGSSGIAVPDWLTEDWCKWFITKWLEEYSEVQTYFDLQYYRARRYGMSWDLFGRIRRIPEVRSVHKWIKLEGLRQAQNLPVTSTAAGQFKLCMAQIEEGLLDLLERGHWCWPLVPIHDALLVECAEGSEEAVSLTMENAMDSCMTDKETGEHRFRVPIKSDGEVMNQWIKG